MSNVTANGTRPDLTARKKSDRENRISNRERIRLGFCRACNCRRTFEPAAAGLARCAHCKSEFTTHSDMELNNSRGYWREFYEGAA